MKKKLFTIGIVLFVLSSAFMIQSCDKAKDLVAFDVSKQLPDHHFDLDSATTTVKGETMLYESLFDIDLDSILEANGMDRGQIEGGEFEEIVLLIDNPSALEEFGFISTLTFKLSESEDFASSLEIARATNIKKGDTEIKFTVNGETLDQYLQNSTFYFRLYGTLESPVPVDRLALILRSKVGFTVKPLN
jgi:hypothetical protein